MGTLYRHTDPRGEAEYNLALGQRRAGSVAAYLGSRRVGAAQLTLSRGQHGRGRGWLGARSPGCPGAAPLPEVVAEDDAQIDAFADVQITDGKALFWGDKPTTHDATAYAFAAGILCPAFDNDIYKHATKKKNSRLHGSDEGEVLAELPSQPELTPCGGPGWDPSGRPSRPGRARRRPRPAG